MNNQELKKVEYTQRAILATSLTQLMASNGFSTYCSLNQITAQVSIHTDNARETAKAYGVMAGFSGLWKKRETTKRNYKGESYFFTIYIDF